MGSPDSIARAAAAGVRRARARTEQRAAAQRDPPQHAGHRRRQRGAPHEVHQQGRHGGAQQDPAAAARSACRPDADAHANRFERASAATWSGGVGMRLLLRRSAGATGA